MQYSQLPWNPKLAQNAAQANLPGNAAWRLINTISKADGSIRKRYGTDKITQYIMCKTAQDPAHTHDFSTVGEWTGLDPTYNPTAPSQYCLYSESLARVFKAADLLTTKTITHAQQGSITLSGEHTVALRFSTKFNALPATTAGGYFQIKLDTASGATKAILFQVSDEGITGLASSSGYIDGERHTWELHFTTSTSLVTVYKDDVQIGTFTSTTAGSTAGQLSSAGATLVIATANVLDVEVDYIHVASKTAAGDTLWNTQPIRGLFSYTNSIQNDYRVGRHFTLAHSGTGVWVDEGGDGRYRQIVDDLTDPLGIPTYCVFRDKVYFTDSVTTTLRGWEPFATVYPLGAPPCAFVRSYAARLWVTGDPLFPLRLYWCGIRDPNDWTTQTAGNFLTSGFLDLEEWEGGDRIVGMAGPWNGVLVIYTTKTIQVVDGSAGDPNLFSRRTIVYGLGGAAANGTAYLGNDLVFLSERGVHSLATTEKFGDMQQAYMSVPIDDLWNLSLESEFRILPYRAPHFWGVSHSTEPWVMFSVTLDDGINNNYVLVWDYRAETWHIWDIDVACMTEIITDSATRYVAYGGNDGHVYYFNPAIYQDNGSDYTVRVESAAIDLKDFPVPDVFLRDHVKLFRNIFLHLRPYSTTDALTLTVWADEKDAATYTITHNVYSTDIGLDDAATNIVLGDPETISVPSQQLDTHAKYIKFKLEQTTGNFALLGWELDFTDEGLRRAYAL
jgi:hypothetical protein